MVLWEFETSGLIVHKMLQQSVVNINYHTIRDHKCFHNLSINFVSSNTMFILITTIAVCATMRHRKILIEGVIFPLLYRNKVQES